MALGIDFDIFENELGAVYAFVAELLNLPAGAIARSRLAGLGIGLGDDEHGKATMAAGRVRIGTREEGYGTTLDAIGDPGFRAVDHVGSVFGTAGTSTDGTEIGAGIRLRQTEAATDLAGGEERQPKRFLRIGAELLDNGCHQQMRIEDAGERHPSFADQGDDAGISGCGQAEAAIFGRDGCAEQTQFDHLRHQFGGVDIVMLE
jgi:hypothetical protein